MTPIAQPVPRHANEPAAATNSPQNPPPGTDHGGSFLARIRRHLAVLIVAKIVFLALLYLLFFSTAHRPDVTPDRVDRLLFRNE